MIRLQQLNDSEDKILASYKDVNNIIKNYLKELNYSEISINHYIEKGLCNKYLCFDVKLRFTEKYDRFEIFAKSIAKRIPPQVKNYFREGYIMYKSDIEFLLEDFKNETLEYKEAEHAICNDNNKRSRN